MFIDSEHACVHAGAPPRDLTGMDDERKRLIILTLLDLVDLAIADLDGEDLAWHAEQGLED